MKKFGLLLSTACLGLCLAIPAYAQVTLSDTSYTQDFDSLGSGLPTGWAVYTSASISILGTSATFITNPTSWATTTVGSDFRNISSDNITYTGTGSTQNANTNRALGLRPVGSNSSEVTPARTGAVTLAISNTSGLNNFDLSLDIFTVNITASSQTYQLEYRVGDTGDFTLLSTYTTPSTSTSNYDNVTTLTANSVTLSALNDQSSTVYIRLRGTSTSGATNLDQIGIDNFSLTYSAISSPVPEPSTYAALMGALALAGVMIVRHRKRIAA